MITFSQLELTSRENTELKQALDVVQEEKVELQEEVQRLKETIRVIRKQQRWQLQQQSSQQLHPSYSLSNSRRLDKSPSSSSSAAVSPFAGLRSSPHPLTGSDENDDKASSALDAEAIERISSMFQALHDAFDPKYQPSTTSSPMHSSNPEDNKTVDSARIDNKSLWRLLTDKNSLRHLTNTVVTLAHDLVEADSQCQAQEEDMVSGIRGLAEAAVGLLVEAETSHRQLTESFASVGIEFVPKKPEPDPYKYNVKTAERDKRRRRPRSTEKKSSSDENGGDSGSGSNDDNSSGHSNGSSSAEEPQSSPKRSKDDDVDFLFGSPSLRFPVRKRRHRRGETEDDEEEEDQDNNDMRESEEEGEEDDEEEEAEGAEESEGSEDEEHSSRYRRNDRREDARGISQGFLQGVEESDRDYEVENEEEERYVEGEQEEEYYARRRDEVEYEEGDEEEERYEEEDGDETHTRRVLWRENDDGREEDSEEDDG